MEQCNHVAVKHRGWQLIIDHGSLSLSFPCFPGLCSSPKQHARVNQVFAPTWGGGCMSLMDPAQLECHSFSSGLALYIIRHTLRSAGGSAGCNGFLLLFCSALTTHPSHGAASGTGQSLPGRGVLVMCSRAVRTQGWQLPSHQVVPRSLSIHTGTKSSW